LVFSNSVDLDSSKANLELAKECPKSVIPFVGIHPQSVLNIPGSSISDSEVERLSNGMEELIPKAKGIGEIGLDPKYQKFDLQIKLFEMQLRFAEKTRKPVTIHSRETGTQILEMISSYALNGKLLFHWFAGTDDELSRLQDRGIYVSFGPALLFSNRLSRLLRRADPSLVLAETDSPLKLESLVGHSLISPFVVTSVLFEMGQVLKVAFEEISERIYCNSIAYIQPQNSLSLITE
jgi:TatD DNase family protein